MVSKALRTGNKEPKDQGDWGFLGPVNHAQLVSMCPLIPSLVSRVTSSSQPQAQEGRSGNCRIGLSPSSAVGVSPGQAGPGPTRTLFLGRGFPTFWLTF